MENDKTIKPVSIRYNEEGEPDGIRISVLDEDFTIALHDACDHDVTTAEARALGQAPTLKQAHLICAYLDEVQQALIEAGGDRLEYWFVTSADYSAANAWSFCGTIGCVSTNNRYYANFRSRPILA